MAKKKDKEDKKAKKGKLVKKPKKLKKLGKAKKAATDEPCCCGEPAAAPEPAAAASAPASASAPEPAAAEPCCCGSDEQAAATSDKPCCGSEASASSECCSDSAYSCEDDPYKGYKKNVIVDFLFLDLTVCDRCQGTDERVFKAVEKCRPVLEACGYNLVLNQIDIENAELAERYRFYSSPTVRVNGVDVCPSIEENDCDCCREISDYDVKCRIFPFNGTYYEVPPTDMLVANIVDVVIKQKKAEPEEGPYELPENLRGFFAGKKKKAAKKSCC